MPAYSKCLQVTLGVRQAIVSREWKPEEKIPSFGALAKRFGVGVGTVRRAVAALEASGILISRHGSGTYVASFENAYWNRFQRYQRIDGTIPNNYHAEMLRFEIIPASSEIAAKLGLQEGDEVIHWIRLMRVDDDDYPGIDQSWLPHSRFPNIGPETFAQNDQPVSLYGLFEQADGVLIASSSDFVTAERLPKSEAKLIGAEENAVMLVVTRTSYGAKGRPVEFRIEKSDARSVRIRL
jgi:GntR family transcriptional regulator